MTPRPNLAPLLFALCGTLVGCSASHVGGEPPADAGAMARPDAAAMPRPDAAAAARCDDLGEVACAGTAGCVPTYDDVCCPTCTDGPCADCVDYAFFTCRSFEDACMAAFCSRTSPWGCDVGAEPDCSGATPLSERSCSVVGCVPSLAPLPDPGEPVCVPVTAASCTALCEREPPDCPPDTVPEGDGSCYTDRCIPAFLCRAP